MRRFFVSLTLVALVLTLAVMPAFAEKIEVTFWHAMSKGHSPIMEELINKFNNSQDEIEIIPIYQGSYGDLNKKLMGAVAAGKPPVMAQVYEDWTTKFVAADALEAVQWYIGSVYTQEEIDDYIWAFQKSNTWDDIMYTVPFNKSTNLLFINTDFTTKIPTTWDELVEVCVDATKDTDGDGNTDVYGLGLRATVDTFNIFLRQAGGDYLNEEGKAMFNNEDGVQALQFLHDLIYKYGAAKLFQGYESGPMGEGQIAMYMGSSAGMPYVAEGIGDKWAWTAAPLPAGDVAAAPFMGTNLAVFSDNPDDVKYAAMEFIKFLTNAENTTFWATRSGYLPVRYSALDTEEWQAFVDEDPKNAAGPAQYDYGTFDPSPDGWYAARSIISDYVESALLNEMSVEDALNQAAKEVNAALGF